MKLNHFLGFYSTYCMLHDRRTRAEYTFTTFAAISAFSGYTWMLAVIVRLLTQGDPAMEEYRTVFDTMMRFCRHIGVSKPEQDRVREYLEQSQDMMANKFYSQYLVGHTYICMYTLYV